MVTQSPSVPKGLMSQIESRKSILVVEDEAEIRQLVVLHLRREGFDVNEVGDGEEARGLLSTNNYDLVILDWMLPSLSGLEITRWMRKRAQMAYTAILFVTAKAEPEHVATCLDAGADDYLSKPFDTLVLMARVNALLRRQDWLKARLTSAPASALTLGELVLDRQTFEVRLAGELIELTRSEFRLMESLLDNQGKVLSREALMAQIQGEGVNVVGRTVDTHIFGLRKKLGAFSDYIETIRGVGYRVRYPAAK